MAKEELELLRDALAKSEERFERLLAHVEQSKQPNELTMNGVAEARVRELVEPPQPQKFRVIEGKSEETGSTFKMVVVQSKAHQHGRVVRLTDYRFPKGIDIHQQQGGLVPDGHPIYRVANSEMVGNETARVATMDPLYKQWRWENYFQADLRSIVGKELRERYCVDPNALKAPWEDSKVTIINEDAAAN